MADFSIKIIDPSIPINDTKTYLIEVGNNLKPITFIHNLENITNVKFNLHLHYNINSHTEKPATVMPPQCPLIKDTDNRSKVTSLATQTELSTIGEQNIQTKTQTKAEQAVENKPSNIDSHINIIDSSFYEKKFDQVMDQQPEINEDFHFDEAKLFPLNNELNHHKIFASHQPKRVEREAQTQIPRLPQPDEALNKALTELITLKQIHQKSLEKLQTELATQKQTHQESLEKLQTELVTQKQAHQESLEKLQAELVTQKQAHQEAHEKAQAKLTAQIQSSQESLDKAHMKLTEQEKVNQNTLVQLQQANDTLEQLQHTNKVLEKALTELVDLEMDEQEDQIIIDTKITPTNLKIDEQEIQTRIQQTIQLTELANAELVNLEIEKKEIQDNIQKETQAIEVAKLELMEKETKRKEIQTQIQEEAKAIKQGKHVLDKHVEILLTALTNNEQDIQTSITSTQPKNYIDIEEEFHHLSQTNAPFSYMNKYNKYNDNYNSDNSLLPQKKARLRTDTVKNRILSEGKISTNEENTLTTRNQRESDIIKKAKLLELNRKIPNNLDEKHLNLQNKMSEMIEEISRKENQSAIQTSPQNKNEQGTQTEIVIRKDLAVQTVPLIVIEQGIQTDIPLVTEETTSAIALTPPIAKPIQSKKNIEAALPDEIQPSSTSTKKMAINATKSIRKKRTAHIELNRKEIDEIREFNGIQMQHNLKSINNDEYLILKYIQKSSLPKNPSKEEYILFEKLKNTKKLPKINEDEHKILKQILNLPFYQKVITSNLQQPTLIAAVSKMNSSSKKNRDDEDEEQNTQDNPKKDTNER